jgi:hypothetical protein
MLKFNTENIEELKTNTKAVYVRYGSYVGRYQWTEKGFRRTDLSYAEPITDEQFKAMLNDPDYTIEVVNVDPYGINDYSN